MADVSFAQSMAALAAGIVLIVLLTTRYKTHAFFALLLACLVVGLAIQLPMPNLVATTKSGFGNIMGALGLIIILGTALGVVLEHTGCTTVLANRILKRTGAKRSPMAMNMTGYVVGLPIFCDSGFIVLSGLNKTIAQRTGVSLIVMASSLASGLYAVHCLIPPHPGAAAATATLGASFGKVILYGMLAAIPAAYCGYRWSCYAGGKIPKIAVADDIAAKPAPARLPSFAQAILPVAVPIILIGIHAFIGAGDLAVSWPLQLLHAAGIPEVALAIGLLLAIASKRRWKRDDFNPLLRTTVEKAGEILVIIGAGGSFGAILAQADLGRHFADSAIIGSMGVFFPFLVAAVLKTAQGSSSVAIITASSIVLPLLPALGLDHDNGRIWAVLALGAGSMVVSHANDSYFWVIARFSGIGMAPMLRVYTVGTLIMGAVAVGTVYLFSLLW